MTLIRLLIVSSFLSVAVMANPSPDPSPTASAVPTATPEPGEEPTPDPSATPALAPPPQEGAPITDKEVKTLLREFRKSQATEARALRHRQSMEIREMKASQNARRKEWDKRERDSRRKFFNDNSKGTDRRAYVKDLLARRKAFLISLETELKGKYKEHDDRKAALKEDQRKRMKEFERFVTNKMRPPENLWPRPGL